MIDPLDPPLGDADALRSTIARAQALAHTAAMAEGNSARQMKDKADAERAYIAAHRLLPTVQLRPEEREDILAALDKLKATIDGIK